MSEIRISVAVATYNGEQYIKEQLDSILENISQKDEIVISDDGSEDKTLQIVEDYRNKDDRIHIFKGPRAGIKQNIARAMENCQGDYIFLADQDDVWKKDKVKKVMEYLGKNGCRLVLHDARVMDQNLTKVLMPSFFAYRGTKSGILANIWKNRYMGCCMAFERSLLPMILPIPDEIEMHDQWIGVLSDMSGGHTICLKEALIDYRRHEHNVSDFGHGTILQMLRKRVIFCQALLRRGRSKM